MKENDLVKRLGKLFSVSTFFILNKTTGEKY